MYFDTDNKQGLLQFFEEEIVKTIGEEHIQALSILNYFATSLFDKHSVHEVLWSITENCISQLNLEDCVIYILDHKSNTLVQKAAYGKKNKKERKVVSPIVIPLRQGIVGHVATSGVPEIVDDTEDDERYIIDDKPRSSELTVPIFCNNQVIGVIDSEHSEIGFFTKHHLQMFQLIAQLLEKKMTHLFARKKNVYTDDNSYFQAFLTLVETKKIYKNQDVSLSMVANMLGISANYLSQLINKLTHENFTRCINTYRVEETCKMLRRKEYAHYSITGIGLESGFKSKSTFYKAFKRIKGITPRDYKNKSAIRSSHFLEV